MKNLFGYFVLSVSLLCLLGSCEREKNVTAKLNVPNPVLKEQSGTSFTVTWNPIKDAVEYEYEFMDKSEKTTDTELTFENLKSESYTFKVRAIAADPNLNSGWGEITVNMSGEEETFSFGMDTKVEGLTLTVTTQPDDKNMTYYIEVLTEEIYAESDYNPEVAYRTMIEDFAIYFGGKDKVYDQIDIRSGDTEKIYSLDKYGVSYYVLVAGIDKDMNITTVVESAEVVVDRAGESDNTFTVNTEELAANMIKLKIIPSNSDRYAYTLIDTKDIDGFQGNAEDFVSARFGPDYFEETYSGERTVLYEKGIKPESNYTFLVFGWEGGITTNVFRHDVVTEASDPSADLTFEFSAKVIGSDKIKVSVFPSNEQAAYYWTLLTKDEYEKYKEDLSEYCRDVSNQWGINPGDYMYQFASVGKEENVIVDRLIPSTEYVLFAVGVELYIDDFKFYEPQIYDKPLVTLDKTEEPLTFSTLEISALAGANKGKIYVYISPDNYDAQ